MKNRIVSIILTITLFASLCVVVAPEAGASLVSGEVFHGTPSNGIRWDFYSDGRLVIERTSGLTTGFTMPTNWSASVNQRPPWEPYREQIKSVDIGSGVSTIGSYAFNGYPNLETVTAASVTSIKSYAFYNCTGLKYVDIPSVEIIENHSFYGCRNLISRNNTDTALRINMATSIGNYAFSGCVELGAVSAQSLTSIGERAFEGCVKLDRVFSRVLHTIEDYAFYGCVILKNIPLPSRMRRIGTGVFVGCDSLELTEWAPGGYTGDGNLYISSQSSILYYGTTSTSLPWDATVVKAIGQITNPELEIPDFVSIDIGGGLRGFRVTTIDAEAFASQTNIVSVTITSFVTNIREGAFARSEKLETVIFLGDKPTTPTSINATPIFDDGITIYYRPGTEWLMATTPSTWMGHKAIAIIDKMTLNRADVKLEVGESIQLKPNELAPGLIPTGTWTSLDDDGNPCDFVHVTQDGVVVAVSTGSSIVEFETQTLGRTVTATSIVTVDVKKIPVSGVAFAENRVTMTVGDTPTSIVAVVSPVGASADLVWSIRSGLDVVYLDLEVPTATAASLTALSAGTAVVRAASAEDPGKYAEITVIVESAPSYTAVTDITLSTTTIALGAKIDLNEISTVAPSNATNQDIVWERVDGASTTSLDSGTLSILGNATYTSVTVRATIEGGRSDGQLAFTKEFTLNVASFLPVTGIMDVPTAAFVGVPLQLQGTVYPSGASFKEIDWELKDPGDTGAYIDPITNRLVAQKSGIIEVVAIIKNGVMGEIGLDIFSQVFTIRVNPYNPNTLTLQADFGGSVGGAGSSRLAGGETITITAYPNQGYIFAGWYSTEGGDFADANRATTQFTMPGNATTVTAYFTYVGVSTGGSGDWGSGGDVVLPAAVHYFTHGGTYTRGSGANFAHVTVRSFSLFSHVVLNGRTLVRNQHYTTGRGGSSTEITIANGYLDTLNQGQHVLEIHFTDRVSVSAVFTIRGTSQTAPIYDDVFTSNWYYDDVAYVSSRGWMTSNSSEPRRFRPSDSVTQGELVDALYRMAGSPAISQSGYPLQGRDAALAWVRTNNILPLSGSYSLSSAITRQDIVYILARFATVRNLRYTTVRAAPNFSDTSQIDSAARTAVTNLYRAGIINGRTESTFVPLGNMTRAECAATLHRYATSMRGW